MSKRYVISLIVVAIIVTPLLISCGQKKEENTSAGAQSQTTDQSVSQTAKTPEATTSSQSTTPLPPQPTPGNITGVEKKVVDTLLALWQLRSNTTSLDQAAKIVNVALTDSMRVDLLNKFLANLSLSERLTRYQPYTFVLNNKEKLVGLYIIDYEHKNSEFPSLKNVVDGTKLPEAEVKLCLKSLAKFEFLFDLGAPDQYNKLGFSYGEQLNHFTFDLGLHYHEFSVDGGPIFNVGCAKEALLLVLTLYAKNSVNYHTVDPLTTEPIDVHIKNGIIESFSPDSTTLLVGGTCGTNSLFVSGANAETWARMQPPLLNAKSIPMYGLREGLESVKKQAK